MTGPREEVPNPLVSQRRLVAPHEPRLLAQIEVVLHLVHGMPGKIRKNERAVIALAKKAEDLLDQRHVPLHVTSYT